MPKLYISPSTQMTNACYFGDNENDHCQMYADILECYLKSCSIDYMRNRTGTAAEAVKESNTFLPDLHYACHTNAFNEATRYSVLLVFSGDPNSLAQHCCEHLKKYRSDIYPRPIYINQNRQIYEVLRTKAPCIYDEILFHDNSEDALLFHTRMQDFARATAMGFCDYFGIPFVEPEEHDFIPASKSGSSFMQCGSTPCACECELKCDDLKALYAKSLAELGKLKEQYNALKDDIGELARRYDTEK